jgi:L-amino acid N-acyltransferase YncA
MLDLLGWRTASRRPHARHARQARGVELRPIEPADAAGLGTLFQRQSAAARRLRFHGAVSLSAARLAQMASTDGHQASAWVATRVGAAGPELVAEARWARARDGTAEVALLVDDRWSRHGLGLALLQALHRQALQAGLSDLHAWVSPDNAPMQALLRHAGYAPRGCSGDGDAVLWSLRLQPLHPAHPPHPPHPLHARHPLRAWWPRACAAALAGACQPAWAGLGIGL